VQKVKEAEVLQHHLLPKTAGREHSKVRIAVDSEQELALEIQVAERNAPGRPIFHYEPGSRLTAASGTRNASRTPVGKK
jgi:hypothetical protein